MSDLSKDASAPIANSSEPKRSMMRAAEPIPPRRCRNYIRKEASIRWNVIVGNLLDKAQEASVSHIALVAKLAGFELGPMPPRAPKRARSLARQLREEMEELEARNIAEFGE